MLRRGSVTAAVAGALTGWGLVRLARERGTKSFFGKTVVIVGGSRGLGLELAREFANRGAKLALLARDGAELERAKLELEDEGVDVDVFTCDVMDRAALDETIESVLKRFGSIDVLVNNAGIIEVGPVDLMTQEDFDEAMRVHFYGPLTAIFSALPALRSSRGRIVNISSIGGKISVPHLLPYCASKFALVGLSQGLHSELARHGIRVTTVCPGLMRTGSVRNAMFKGQHKLEYAWFALGDALPFSSVSSSRAARKIVDACQRGAAELIVGWQFWAAAKVNALFPNLTAYALTLVDKVLPAAGGIGSQSVLGSQSEGVLPSWVTALDSRAAARNNEL